MHKIFLLCKTLIENILTSKFYLQNNIFVARIVRMIYNATTCYISVLSRYHQNKQAVKLNMGRGPLGLSSTFMGAVVVYGFIYLALMPL